MAIESVLENHVSILEQSVKDIVDNRLTNRLYVQQTLHFLRHTLVSTFLDGNSRERVAQLWQIYQKLASYSQTIEGVAPATSPSSTLALAPIQVSDRIALYQMQKLGIPTGESPIVLTDQENEQLKSIQDQVRASRKERSVKLTSQLKSLSTTDSVTLALGAALGIDLKP
jgi:hypothetical protein